MRGIGSTRGLKGAVLARGLRGSPARYDGFGGFQGGGGQGANTNPAGAVPAGGAAGGGGPGTSPPVVPPPQPQPGPPTQPGAGGPPNTAPSPGQPQPGQYGGQPAANPNLVPQPGQPQPGQPGQPQNPMAVLATLPPAAQAYVQGLQRNAQQWEQNRFFAQLGYQQWQQAQGQQRGGQPQPGQGAMGGGQVGPQGQLLPAPPAAPANPWNVPRFDLGQLSMIRRNPETGAYEAAPGAPPGLAQQAEAYQQAVVQATHSFFQDPRKAIEGLVREIAGEVAEQRSTQHLGQYQQQQFAQQTLQQNAEWMYQRDAAGNVVQEFDMRSGAPKAVLSPWGQEYARRVIQLNQAGVTDGRMQHQLAIEGLQNLAYQIMRQQQQPAPAGQQPQNQPQPGGQPQFVPGTPPGYGQVPPGQLPPPGPGTPGRKMSLREELSGVYSANGFTDQALAQGIQTGFGQGYGSLAG